MTLPECRPMCHDPVSALRQALESNEFDIVGLADLPDDELFLTRCLREVALSLIRREMPASHAELGQVLYALVQVAQDEYGDGHGYWPHLEQRIAAARDSKSFQMTQERQASLGDWFRHGLATFGYSSPRAGQVNVGPILWHAGCPRKQLPHLYGFVLACVDRYGEAALDPDALFDLRLGEEASRWSPALPRAVARLLHDNPAGAGELWRRLAIAARAWREGGEEALREAWEDLAGITVSDLLAALARLAQPSTLADQPPLRPRLRYDGRTGEVRLWLVEGRSEDWEITGLALRWEGASALLLRPPPAVFSLRHRPTMHQWQESTWLPDRPVIFFSCPAGALERGDAVAARGLEAGPWYLLLRGRLADLTAKQRRPLAWSSLQGGEGWTAWQVEVPPRGARRAWVLTCDGEQLEVPLARRSGPRLEVSEAALTAETPEGQPVEVFAEPPQVWAGAAGLAVRLLRRRVRSAELVRSFDLASGTAAAIAVPEPGVYQLRAAGGGRALLDFAVLPGLTIRGPAVEGEMAHLAMTTNAGLGRLHGDRVESQAPQHWCIRQPTVEPWLSAEWQWPDPNDPTLCLRWSVQALRWRLLNLGNDLAAWTRETRVVERRRVAPTQAVLQIQVPPDDSLTVNGVALAEDRGQPGPSGVTYDVGLLGYTTAEAVALQVGNAEYRAVLLAERPLLSDLQARREDGRLRMSWAAEHLPAGTLVVAWDPCDPASDPVALPLDGPNRTKHTWQGPKDWPFDPQRPLGVTLGVKLSAGFGITAARLQPALDWTGRPLTRLVLPTEPEKFEGVWLELFHRWGDRLRWGGLPPDGSPVREEAPKEGPFPAQLARKFLDGLGKLRPPGQSPGWDRMRVELEDLFAIRAAPDALRELLRSHDPTAGVMEWLGQGIHLGWRSPYEYLKVQASDQGYPLGYFRDLWLLNSDAPVEQRREAAGRVHALHTQLALFEPTAGLPLARAKAGCELWFATRSDKGHAHRLHPLTPETDDREWFFRQVGVEDCDLEAEAGPADEFPRSAGPPPQAPKLRRPRPTLTAGVVYYQPTKYMLAHLPDSAGWELYRFEWQPVERRMKSRRCCEGVGPLLTEAWQVTGLMHQLDVRGWLLKESAAVATPAGSRLSNDLQAILLADNELRVVHREILEPPPVKSSMLFGNFAITLPAYEDVPEAGKAAWALAWVDRLAAREAYPQATVPRAFLQALHTALLPGGDWGRLLTGCLVIAEYALTILREGGLGPAFRFVL